MLALPVAAMPWGRKKGMSKGEEELRDDAPPEEAAEAAEAGESKRGTRSLLPRLPPPPGLKLMTV